MGSILATSILTRAGTILQDTTNVRWPLKELCKWLDDGQREIVVIKPEASVTNAAWKLVAGTKQRIPDGSSAYPDQVTSAALPNGIQLLDLVRNMGTTTTPTPGRVVRLVDRRILDAQSPLWHQAVASAVVIHYSFDEFDPKHFYVYPPQPTVNMGYIEGVYSCAPVDITKVGGAGQDAEDPKADATINLDDIYSNALLDYVLYRAYSKDANYASNEQRAMGHYNAFLGALGKKESGEQLSDVNLRAGK